MLKNVVALIALAITLLSACNQQRPKVESPAKSPATEEADATSDSPNENESDTKKKKNKGSPESSQNPTDEPETAPDQDETAQPNTEACTAEKVVRFVYFVEKDAAFDERKKKDIEAQALKLQQFWYDQLGKTFFLSDPIVNVVEGKQNSSWYIATPDQIHDDNRWYRLGNIKTEVYDKLGIVDFDPNTRVVNYVTTRSDGKVGANFGGAWMDGDDLTCMPSGVTYPFPDQVAAHCLGHVAHELGHVFGLGHKGAPEDCMQFGFYNNTNGTEMCGFGQDNVNEMLALEANKGWLEAKPGDSCKPRQP